MEITTDFLKTQVLSYWRYKRNYWMAATEVNTGIEIADILLCDDKEIIEIEVKTTWSDFKADFKKVKHIKKDCEWMKKYFYLKANKFYFCVHPEISDKCQKYLETNNYNYGLLTFSGELCILKSCRKLKELRPREIEQIKKSIIYRTSSEMVHLRKELLELKTNYKEEKINELAK